MGIICIMRMQVNMYVYPFLLIWLLPAHLLSWSAWYTATLSSMIHMVVSFDFQNCSGTCISNLLDWFVMSDFMQLIRYQINFYHDQSWINIKLHLLSKHTTNFVNVQLPFPRLTVLYSWTIFLYKQVLDFMILTSFLASEGSWWRGILHLPYNI